MSCRKVLLLLSVLSVGGCAGVERFGPEVALPPAAQRSVANAVAYQMKDPGSAQFRNWHAFTSDKGLIVCGEVNARGGFGGYVGFTHFVAHAAPDGQMLTPAAIVPVSPSGPDSVTDAIWREYYPGCYY
jgi:hypothetical protein